MRAAGPGRLRPPAGGSGWAGDRWRPPAGILFGVPTSPAAVCRPERATAAALAPAAEAARRYAAGRPANVGETGWREGGKRAWLWAAVTRRVTAFAARLPRGRAVLGELIGGPPGVLATDRSLRPSRPPAPSRPRPARCVGRAGGGTPRR